jgi:tRNA(Ile)-lysidine synthase TilS/MesJ
MMLVSEAEVIGFQKRYQLPVCKNPCPADGHTRREYVKQLIRQLERENPGMKKRLFHSILTGNISDWPQALK